MKNGLRQLCIVTALVAFVTSAYALTPPTLTVSDGTNSATVDSTGATVLVGSATAPIHVGSATAIVYGGTVGAFTISAIACTINLSTFAEDCAIQAVSASAGGTLTVTWSDSGLTVSGAVSGGSLDAGGTFTGTGSVTFSAVVNGGTVATLGPFASSPFSGSTVGPANGTSPVTENEVVAFNFAASAFGGGDFQFIPVITPPTGGGCPGTPGFWKNAKKHPFPASLTFPVTIGGVAYSSADFYTILGGNRSGGNAVSIMGFQLVAAILNIAAGATNSPAVDNAINLAESYLQVGLPGGPVGVAFPINMTTGFVQASTALGTAMTNVGIFLDGYNSANFGTCSEGSGLTLGGH